MGGSCGRLASAPFGSGPALPPPAWPRLT